MDHTRMDYTRVTVHGSARRSDLVLPNAEPLVDIMPALLDLLDEDPTRSGSMRLSTIEGVQLDPEKALADQHVLDGALLHLVPVDQAPPPPEISDVTEAVLLERERRRDVWNQAWARRAATASAAVLGFLAARLVLPTHGRALTWAIALAVVAVALAARRTTTWPVPGLIALVCGGAVATGAWQAGTLAHAQAHLRVAQVLGAVAVGWLALALTAGWGARRRPVLVGAALGAVAAAVPLVLQAVGLSYEASHVVSATAATLAIGLLPGWAMAMSGLSGLDDQIVGGRAARRDAAATLARDAFATLGWLAVGLCVPLTISLMVLARTPGRWTAGLAIALGVTLACRARFFPLAEQVAALWAMVGVLGVTLLTGWVWQPVPRAAILAVVALVIVLVLSGRPADHTRARLRTWLNLLEQFAVLAVIPVLLGWFGVYHDLLQAFHR